jgi:hypothetical protein
MNRRAAIIGSLATLTALGARPAAAQERQRMNEQELVWFGGMSAMLAFADPALDGLEAVGQYDSSWGGPELERKAEVWAGAFALAIPVLEDIEPPAGMRAVHAEILEAFRRVERASVLVATAARTKDHTVGGQAMAERARAAEHISAAGVILAAYVLPDWSTPTPDAD